MQDTGPAFERFEFTTFLNESERARIGLSVLQSDQTMEQEMRQMTDGLGVSLYHARLPNDTVVTPDTLAKMEAVLPIAAALLSKYLGLHALGYGCTSGATIIGEDRVTDIIRQSHRAVTSSNPLSAAKAALKTLGITRLGLLTPYRPEVTEALQRRFEEVGIAVTVAGSFDQKSDIIVAQIDPASILSVVVRLGQSEDCDGVFISCTGLRAVGIVEKAERQHGKPITSSNQALAWHLLQLAGIEDKLDGFGQLFQT